MNATELDFAAAVQEVERLQRWKAEAQAEAERECELHNRVAELVADYNAPRAMIKAIIELIKEQAS